MFHSTSLGVEQELGGTVRVAVQRGGAECRPTFKGNSKL